jgi:hypothetical protein
VTLVTMCRIGSAGYGPGTLGNGQMGRQTVVESCRKVDMTREETGLRPAGEKVPGGRMRRRIGLALGIKFTVYERPLATPAAPSPYPLPGGARAKSRAFAPAGRRCPEGG